MPRNSDTASIPAALLCRLLGHPLVGPYPCVMICPLWSARIQPNVMCLDFADPSDTAISCLLFSICNITSMILLQKLLDTNDLIHGGQVLINCVQLLACVVTGDVLGGGVAEQ